MKVSVQYRCMIGLRSGEFESLPYEVRSQVYTANHLYQFTQFTAIQYLFDLLSCHASWVSVTYCGLFVRQLMLLAARWQSIPNLSNFFFRSAGCVVLKALQKSNHMTQVRQVRKAPMKQEDDCILHADAQSPKLARFAQPLLIPYHVQEGSNIGVVFLFLFIFVSFFLVLIKFVC